MIVLFFIVLGMSGIFEAPPLPLDDANPEHDLISTEEPKKNSGTVNILLLGTDKGGFRTDTIMVASYNLDENAINILSVPRDTRMYIGSYYQRINSAYSSPRKGYEKGAESTIEAVTRLTGIPINYYVVFSCSAFRDVIDALGGVYFDVPQNMKYSDPVQDLYINLKKGYQLLDGDKAEQLVRFRRYPEGDLERVRVQQAFIKAVAEQNLNASIITELPALFNAVEENVETNFKLADVIKYAPSLASLDSENITVYETPGVANDTDYGASYYIANMTELAELIETVFDYDASRITIHSSYTKNSTATQAPSKSTASPKATKSPSASQTPKPSESPAPTAKPTATAKPKSTSDPKSTATPTAAPKATEKTSSTATPKPTATAEPTEKPTATPKATPKATEAAKTEAPEKTAAPTKTPTAAPTEKATETVISLD